MELVKKSRVKATVVFHHDYIFELVAVNEHGELGIILILDDHWPDIDQELQMVFDWDDGKEPQDRICLHPCKLVRCPEDKKLLAVMTAVRQNSDTLLIWKTMKFLICTE